MEKARFHDLRRSKNKEEELRGSTVEQRAKLLGNSARVNRTHYSSTDLEYEKAAQFLQKTDGETLLKVLEEVDGIKVP